MLYRTKQEESAVLPAQMVKKCVRSEIRADGERSE